MKKLDRFTLKAFIGPFTAILLVVVFILMMQTLWLYIDELVGKGLGLRTILEFLFWGVCSLALPLALPLARLHTRPSAGAMQRVEPFAPESRPCINPSFAVRDGAPLSNASVSSYTFSVFGESGTGRSISIES